MIKLKQKGFSLIEIIAVTAIGLILISVVLFSFSSFRNSKIIDVSADQVFSVINEARVKSVSSEDYSRFGIHFEVGKVIFFKGDSYVSQNPANVEMELSSLVEISDISLSGGGSNIIFQKLTGKTGNYGSLRVRLKSDNSKYKIISVKSTGIANIQ